MCWSTSPRERSWCPPAIVQPERKQGEYCVVDFVRVEFHGCSVSFEPIEECPPERYREPNDPEQNRQPERPSISTRGVSGIEGANRSRGQYSRQDRPKRMKDKPRRHRGRRRKQASELSEQQAPGKPGDAHPRVVTRAHVDHQTEAGRDRKFAAVRISEKSLRAEIRKALKSIETGAK